MYKATRDEEVRLIKDLFAARPTICPKCGEAKLEYFHKKAKKDSSDWICPACGERYRVLRMLDEVSKMK